MPSPIKTLDKFHAGLKPVFPVGKIWNGSGYQRICSVVSIETG